MTCMYCGRVLLGFADAVTVNVNGAKSVACMDREKCNARAAANERARIAGE